MKVLSSEGLNKLIQLIKSNFISNTDVETVSEVRLATVATSGSYEDLSDKPTIPTVNDATLTIQKNSTTVNTFTANASSNVTVDISVPTTVAELSDASDYATTASLATVATSGSYTDLSNTPTIPTVDQTYSGTSTNAQSGTAVKSAIDSAISSVYKPAGSVAFASLPTPTSSNLGNVYNVTDAFTTDNRFVEGTGKNYPAGTNVVIVDTGSSTYKFDVLAGIVDLSGYVPTSRTVNGKALTSNITLTANDVSALPSSTVIPTITDTYSSTSSDGMSGKAVASAISDKQDSNTAVTHTASTAVGSATQPVYIASNGTATATTYELNKTVPADAVFTDTTYSTFTGADGSTAGSAGLVPAPTASDNTKFLKGDGTWATPVADTPTSILDARTDTAIRLWIGTEQQYNIGGGSQTWYNWQTTPTETWSSSTMPSSKSWSTIVYGNDIYLMTGSSEGSLTSTSIGYSTDGINWIEQSINFTYYNPWIHSYNIAFGNNKFILYNSNGNIAYSTDGINWTTVQSVVSSGYSSIKFVNDRFVLGKDNVSIAYSTDGINWTELSLSSDLHISGYYRDIIYGNGKYVLTTTTNAYFSTDFYNWQSVNFDYQPISLGRAFYGGNKFLLAGFYPSYDNYVIYSSTNGIDWVKINHTFSSYANIDGTCFGYTNGKYLLCNYTTDSSFISDYSYSSDGINWINNSFNYSDTNVRSILGNNGTFLTACSGSYWTKEGMFHATTNHLIYTLAVNECFTNISTPTTSSQVYSAPSITSALTISFVSTGTITLSDTNTYNYNQSGNQTTTQNVGQAYPNWLCFIEDVGIKMGNTMIANNLNVNQTYDTTNKTLIIS